MKQKKKFKKVVKYPKINSVDIIIIGFIIGILTGHLIPIPENHTGIFVMGFIFLLILLMSIIFFNRESYWEEEK